MKKARILVITTIMFLNQCPTILSCSYPEAPIPVLAGPAASPSMNQDDAMKIECGICRCAEDSLGNTKMVMLPCSSTHVFHKSCLAGWFAHNVSCPMCRHFYKISARRILPLLKERSPEEIIIIQQAVNAVVSELGHNPALRDVYGLEVKKLLKLIEEMPRDFWERIEDPKTSCDWLCRGGCRFFCGNLWLVADVVYVTLLTCLIFTKTRDDFVVTTEFHESIVVILAILIEGLFAVDYLGEYHFCDEVGFGMRCGWGVNNIEALIAVTRAMQQGLREYQGRHGETHAHEQ